MKKEDERFERTYVQNKWTGGMEIWVDKQTGVNYLFRLHGYGGGLTPLLNADGTPVVTKAEG